MKLYFIRHGESVNNAARIHQGSDGALSEHGVKQAEFVARRFSKIPLDLIIASTDERARQTAEIIARATGHALEMSGLIAERRHPSEVVGKHVDDPEARQINELIRSHYHDASWHYSDGENIADLKARALQFLEFVIALGKENILAVSHGTLLRIILAVMMFGEGLTPQECLRVFNFTSIKNTGVTLCEHTSEGTWILRTWNDHAHLGT